MVGEQTGLGTMSTRAFHRRPLDLFAGNQESKLCISDVFEFRRE